MDIFGFHITRKSKHDRDVEELDKFEKCVNMLYNELNSLSELTTPHHFNMDVEFVRNLLGSEKHVGQLIDIYTSNKFISSVDSMCLQKEMITLSSNVYKCANAATELIRLDNEVSPKDDIPDGEREKIVGYVKHLMKEFSMSIGMINGISVVMSNMVKKDCVRCFMKIDIIKEYYDTQKRMKKGIRKNDIVRSYVVNFVKNDEMNKNDTKGDGKKCQV